MNKLLQKVKENLNLKVILGFVVMTVIFMVGRSVVYVNEIEPRREDVYTADAVSRDKEGTKRSQSRPTCLRLTRRSKQREPEKQEKASRLLLLRSVSWQTKAHSPRLIPES